MRSAVAAGAAYVTGVGVAVAMLGGDAAALLAASWPVFVAIGAVLVLIWAER